MKILKRICLTINTMQKKYMKCVDWGTLYNKYKDEIYDTQKIEEETSKLILDDDVSNKKGIYPYILIRNEKYLNIRAFTDSMKQKVYQKQNGECKICGNHFKLEENCQMLCREDNRRKSGK